MDNLSSCSLYMLEQLNKNWSEYKGKVVPEVFMLSSVYEGLLEVEESAALKHGLQRNDLRTLLHLRSYSPEKTLSPTELFTSLNLTSGGLTKILHRLTDDGLVERIVNPEDKRSTLVRLTDKGDALLAQAMDDLCEKDQNVFSVLQPEERDALQAICCKLLKSLYPEE